MRNLSNDIRANRPVLIQPNIAKAFLERCADIKLPLGAKASDMSDMLAAIFGAKCALEKFPPFAIVPVKGVIGRNLSDLEAACGACDLEAVEEMLEDAERDPSITTIILDVDSPGGSAVGVPELAKRIRECGKRTISFTSGDCCSAAYWIASQASEFYATPSSTVANVGCYIVFNDMSAAYAQEGVAVDVIRSGNLKGAGTPGTSLSKEQRDDLLVGVLEIADNFKADVKLVREFVQDADMEGQCFSGTKAAEKGFVTALTNGFDELMQTLDAEVAAQIEADEANDARSTGGGQAEESDEDEGMGRMAAARALKGIPGGIRALMAKAEKSPDDQEKDGAEPMPKKGKKYGKANSDEEDDEDETPSDPITDEDEDKDKPESQDDEEKPESEEDKDEPKAEDADDEEDADQQPESEDEDDKEPKAEDKDEEKPESEDEDDKEPQAEDEEKDDDDAKEKAEEESDTGDKAVETDEEPEKKGVRNRSRGIA
jgi:protease-4